MSNRICDNNRTDHPVPPRQHSAHLRRSTARMALLMAQALPMVRTERMERMDRETQAIEEDGAQAVLMPRALVGNDESSVDQ